MTDELSLLSVEDLKVTFLSAKTIIKAVDGVSFRVEREDFCAIVGESGSGKTLTALSVMKLLPSTAVSSGKVFFKGKDLMSLTDSDLRKLRGSDISMVFQEPMTSLNPVFTIGDQISEVLLTHQDLTKNTAKEKAVELLRVVRIPSPELRINEYPHQMSGGMRQRIMIAMALACGPSLIIADEPTTALDVTIQAQILELLGELQGKNRMSLLLITHDLGIVAEWARRVEVMYAGRLVERASVRDIFLNPRHPYSIGLLESLPKRKDEKLIPIPGQIPRLDNLPKGCKFAPRCRYAIKECTESEPALVSVGDGHFSRCLRAMEL